MGTNWRSQLAGLMVRTAAVAVLLVLTVPFADKSRPQAEPSPDATLEARPGDSRSADPRGGLPRRGSGAGGDMDTRAAS